ncbi:hypothetical protein BGX21_004232 [Mortierella sp. AD011]|nr:hypothetical protein BGX21_004232 [Mortierella sp. AD011]
MAHPLFDPAQAAAFNELALKRDSTFELRYFGLHGLVLTGRIIVVKTSAGGKITINVAESDTIDRYLAKKFGMAGDNAFEKTVINSYLNNPIGMILKIYLKVFAVRDPALKAEAKEQLLNGPIPTWIKFFEQHLAENGSNGGNKITLPDIKTDIINVIKEGTITKESHPSLMKVKTTLDLIPALKAWRATDEYKAFSEFNLLIDYFLLDVIYNKAR